jgi:hypothetical protein
VVKEEKMDEDSQVEVGGMSDQSEKVEKFLNKKKASTSRIR